MPHLSSVRSLREAVEEYEGKHDQAGDLEDPDQQAAGHDQHGKQRKHKPS